MRRLLPVALVGLLVTSAALAAEPQKKIRPADQARARAMLLKQSDVGLGFRVLPKSSSGPTTPFGLDCAALDEGDLTVTGGAESPTFSSGLHTISSAAQIYISAADARASWRRGTNAAGFACLKKVFRRLAQEGGVRFVSFRRVPFPAVAPQTAGYRWQILANGVRLYTDIVFVMRTRAQAAAFFISGIDPLEQSEQRRLTRLISTRMAKAMRSA
jgi:hypothetical protein